MTRLKKDQFYKECAHEREGKKASACYCLSVRVAHPQSVHKLLQRLCVVSCCESKTEKKKTDTEMADEKRQGENVLLAHHLSACLG